MKKIEFTLSRLEEMIRSQAWSNGERLPPERQLAQSIGVGRNTLRQALHHLQARGIVDIRLGSGCYLVSRELLDASWGPRSETAEGDALEQLEASYCLLPSLVSWCALRADKKTIERLEKCASDLGRAFLMKRGGRELASCYKLFLRVMASETENRLMRSMVETLCACESGVFSGFQSLRDSEKDEVFAGIVQLLQAVRNKDADLAAALTRRQQVRQSLFFCGREAVSKSRVLQPALLEMERESIQ